MRLRVVDRLGHGGPATVSRLAAELDVPLPQLSNHLRRLRDARLVTVERDGRQAVYSLADPGLEALLPLLDRITGRVADAGARRRRRSLAHVLRPPRRAHRRRALPRPARARRGARTSRRARRPRAAAPETFRKLGVQIATVEPGRQRFAFECLDATERAPHLAGALGDALAAALIDRGWVVRDGRTIELSRRGATGLRRLGMAV